MLPQFFSSYALPADRRARFVAKPLGSADRSVPIIVHAHVPKTAGTSFRQLLEHNFGTDCHLHWNPDPLFCFSRPEVERLVEEQPTLRALSSHGLRHLWPQICGRPVLAVTFLRDPIALFFSLLRYTRSKWQVLPPEVKQWWPENTPELTVRELANEYLHRSKQLTGSPSQCLQTRFFCPLTSGKPLFPCDATSYGYNSLYRAAQVLETFFFVGLVEEMEASLWLFRTKLRAKGIDFVVPGRICANQTHPYERLDWLRADDPVGRAVLRAHRNDRRLYRRYAARFRREVRAVARGSYRSAGCA
jgi:hypothetical protein